MHVICDSTTYVLLVFCFEIYVMTVFLLFFLFSSSKLSCDWETVYGTCDSLWVVVLWFLVEVVEPMLIISTFHIFPCISNFVSMCLLD